MKQLSIIGMPIAFELSDDKGNSISAGWFNKSSFDAMFLRIHKYIRNPSDWHYVLFYNKELERTEMFPLFPKRGRRKKREYSFVVSGISKLFHNEGKYTSGIYKNRVDLLDQLDAVCDIYDAQTVEIIVTETHKSTIKIL